MPTTTRPLILPLILQALILCVSQAHALPLGTIGGPEDSLLRVEGTSGQCPPPGTICFEAIGSLPWANYALDGIVNIYASGLVDHVTGETAAVTDFTAPSGGPNSGEFNVHARDLFTVSGPIPGELVSITVRYAVGGTAEIGDAATNIVVEALVSARPDGWNEVNGGMSFSSDGDLFQRTNHLAAVFGIDLEAVYTFDVETGTPFQIVYRTRHLASYYNHPPLEPGDGVSFDTEGLLSFDLPPGYKITSELGYVPEPGTSVSLAVGLTALAAFHRRRSNRGVGEVERRMNKGSARDLR